MANGGGRDWSAIGAAGLYGGSNTYSGGGGSIGNLSSEEMLDFLRRGSPGRTPEAEYPAGYIGTGQDSRRSDKVMQAIRELNSRQYQRGVHVGSRVDPSDYIWPESWNDQRGIKAEMAGHKTQLAAGGPEPRLVRGGVNLPPPPAPSTPSVSSQLGFLAPRFQ